MRISNQKLNLSLKKQIETILAQVLTDLRDLSETQTFLADFLNDSEYEAFAKRLAIAYWLKKGRSYANIKNNLKVSSATIAAIVAMKDKPGIKLALKKLEAEEWASVWTEKIKKYIK